MLSENRDQRSLPATDIVINAASPISLQLSIRKRTTTTIVLTGFLKIFVKQFISQPIVALLQESFTRAEIIEKIMTKKINPSSMVKELD